MHLLDREAALEIEERHRKELERLRKRKRDARTNVVLAIIFAALMFGLALVPVSKPAPWDGAEINGENAAAGRGRYLMYGEIYGDAPRIVGWPIEGEDITDVEVQIDLVFEVQKSSTNYHMGLWEIETGDCTTNRPNLSAEAMDIYVEKKDLSGYADSLTFHLDSGNWCWIIAHLDELNEADRGRATITLAINTWPLRHVTPPLGLLFMLGGLLAWRGARKHGRAWKHHFEPKMTGTDAELEILEALATQDQAMQVQPPSNPYGEVASEQPNSDSFSQHPAHQTIPQISQQPISQPVSSQMVEQTATEQKPQVAPQATHQQYPGWKWDQTTNSWVPDN